MILADCVPTVTAEDFFTLEGWSMDKDNVLIVYFSGTGGTKRIAEIFKQTFNERNYYTIIHPLDLSIQNSLSTQYNEMTQKVKLLFVIYPVYAFDAPQPVYDWIEDLSLGNDISTVVISVSGGGKIWPNTLCRISCIKALERKGYNVFYEEMLVMPSNFIIKTNDDLSMWLLKKIPVRIKKIVDDVITGKRHRIGFKISAKCIHFFSRIEKKYAKLFGLSLMIKESCNGCGWCAKNCPRNNITMVEGKPIFSNQCIICMRCIYGCPSKAICTDKYKFIILKDGYSIESIEETIQGKELQPVKKCSKGYLWSGVRKYLLEKD